MKGYKIDEIEFEDDNTPLSKKLTGEYLTGVSPRSGVEPNAEVEGGEYVQFPDKETQKVAGPDHEQGGVPVNIPDGTKILSKSLNLNKQQVSTIQDIFDIEFSVKDTYASALDKYTKKIGLKRLNDEQEEVFQQLEKIEKKKDIDTKTKRQNHIFLSQKINNIEEQKKPLEQQRAQFFDIVFEMQEKSKADKGDQEAMFRYGGIQREKFETISKKLGLDPRQAAMMLQAKRAGKIENFSLGGEMGTEDVPPYLEREAYTAKGVARLNNYRKKVGLEPLPETSSRQEIQKAVREMQTNMAKENPDLVVDYMLQVSHQPNNKLSGKLKQLGYEQTNDGVKQALKEGKLKNNDIIDAYQDGLWWYRALGTDVKRVSPQEFEEIQRELAQRGVTQGEYSYLYDPKTNTYVRYETGDDDNKGPGTGIITGDNTEDKDPAAGGSLLQDNVTFTPQRSYPKLFFMPDQSVLPPTPPEAHLKANIRLERIDPVRIGIEQTIQDTNDQRNFVSDQLSSLPESQRAALMANLLASSQKTVADAAFKANVTNAQNYAQAEQFNIQQSGQEQLYDTQNALSFEQRQMTAKAKADEALRGYYDYNRKVNITNLQNQQRLNLIDSLFPDFDLDFYGASINYNPKTPWSPTVNVNTTIEGEDQMTPEELKAARDAQRLRNEQVREQQMQQNMRIQQQRAMQAGLLFPGGGFGV
jgi:hypothetical protein